MFYIFAAMIWCHVIDDYFLQGIMAQMKQKKWWNEQTTNPLYKYDYIAALVAHSLSWSFSILIPTILINPTLPSLPIIYIVNAAIHAFVDNLKANKLKINLITDQLIHLAQIIVTFVICMC